MPLEVVLMMVDLLEASWLLVSLDVDFTTI